MNIEIIKKHPVVTGAVIFVGAVIFYLLIKGKSSSSTAPSAGTSDAQLQAVQDAENANAAQYNATLQVAQIQGDVATAQTNAELSAVQAETAAAENIVNTQTAGAVQQTQIQADSTTEQAQITADAQTHIADTAFNDELAAHQAAIDAATTVANHNFDIDSQVIAGANQDKSRSSTGYAQIISALQGQGPAAIAANQPSQVASTNLPGNIISSITGFLGGLF